MEIDADCMLRVVEDKGIEGSEITSPYPGEEIKARTRLPAATTSKRARRSRPCPFHGSAGAEDRCRDRIVRAFRGRFSPVRSRKGVPGGRRCI